MMPKVIYEKCEGCGNCMDVCPVDVFEIEDNVANAVRPEECLDCGACAEECPSQAVELKD